MKIAFAIYRLVRPLGLKRLLVVCAVLFVQALAQMVTVFSVMPFLSAAADMAGFRRSLFGSMFIAMVGPGLSDRALLWAVGGGSLALLLGGNLVTLFADRQKGIYAFRIGHQLRSLLVSKILARRYEYFLGINSSLLTKNLVEDVAIFTQAILTPFLDVLARSLLAILLIGSLLVFQPVVTLIAGAGIGIYCIVVVIPVRRAASRTSEEIKDVVRRLFFEVGQTLTGAKAILANDAQEYFRKRSDEVSGEFGRLMARTTVYPNIPRVGLEMLVFGGLIVWVLVSLAREDLMAIMPQVGLTALVSYRLMPTLQLMLNQSLSISMMRQSMDEVVQLLEEQPRFASGVADVSGAAAATPLTWSNELRFEGVGFTYHGATRPALRDISFTIAKGEHVAFVGPTGSGKSTLIDLVLGLLRPSEGRILVDGEALEASRLPEWRATIGYVPQDLFLLDASIAENIAFGTDADRIDLGRAEEAAALAQASAFIEDEKDKGFWSAVGERGGRLSGGQRQRLALARALYKQPSVLVLDEATSALDPQTEKRLISSVLETADALTIITVAHRLSTVEKCDRIYFVQEGRISACGSFAELLSEHPEFKTFAL